MAIGHEIEAQVIEEAEREGLVLEIDRAIEAHLFDWAAEIGCGVVLTDQSVLDSEGERYELERTQKREDRCVPAANAAADCHQASYEQQRAGDPKVERHALQQRTDIRRKAYKSRGDREEKKSQLGVHIMRLVARRLALPRSAELLGRRGRPRRRR